jgi:hypothetical protein
MNLKRITLFVSTISDSETPEPGIKELLEYKEYLEKELEKVKGELRKKIQK